MSGKVTFKPNALTLVLGCAAIAFALRVSLLDGQSLWGDEAISLGRAVGTMGEIAADARHEGTLPPLYYYALHFWIQLTGTTEFALRFLSVLEGTAAVVLLFAALRISAGTSAATIGALLAAIAPFLIYYSQETRMYAQSLMLATASTALFLRLCGRERPSGARTYVAYVVVSAAAVLTHYFAGFVLLAQNAAAAVLLLVRVVRARRTSPRPPGSAHNPVGSPARTLAVWSFTQIAILSLLAPWVAYARQSLAVTASAVSRQAISLEEIAAHLLRVFSAGASSAVELATAVGVAFAVLATAALVLRPRNSLFWGGALVLPVVVTFYISFTPQVGWARYFIAAAPAWLALAGIGLSALLTLGRPNSGSSFHRATMIVLRISGLTAAAIILVGSAGSLRAYYTDPANARPDWRGALARAAAESLPSTKLVVSGPAWLPELDYYHRGFPARFDLPVTTPSDWPAVQRRLEGIAAGATGIWHLKYYPPDQDADALTEQWLASHAFRSSGQWVENATFSYYSLPVTLAGKAYQPAVTFGGLIRLNSLTVVTAPDRDSAILQLTLEWQAIQTTPADFVVFAHALDLQGHLVGQRDSPPVGGFRPTSGWEPGDVVTDRLGIRVPAAALAAPLQIRIGLYDPAGGARLPAVGSRGESLGDNYHAQAP